MPEHTLLTVDGQRGQCVEDRLKRLLRNRFQLVLVQMEPLEQVQVVEGIRRNLADAGIGKYFGKVLEFLEPYCSVTKMFWPVTCCYLS